MSKGMSRQVRKGQPTPPFLVALRGEVIELLAPEISEKFTSCMIQDLPTKKLPMFEKKSSSKPKEGRVGISILSYRDALHFLPCCIRLHTLHTRRTQSISEISVCVSYAVYAARPSVCSRMQHIVCNRMQSYAVMQFGNAYSGPCVCMCMHV